MAVRSHRSRFCVLTVASSQNVIPCQPVSICLNPYQRLLMKSGRLLPFSSQTHCVWEEQKEALSETTEKQIVIVFFFLTPLNAVSIYGKV